MTNKKIIEYIPIILWKNDKDLYNMFNNEFNIHDTFSFTFDKNELKIKLEKLYHPYEISENDPRIKSQNIKILILKIEDPVYIIGSINEIKNHPLNQSIIQFKEKTRKLYNHTFFHSSNHLNESQHLFKVFGIGKYIIKERFININELLGVIWLNKVNGDYCLTKIENSPHYLYLNDEKQYYVEYVTKIDKNHNTKKYDKLINSINSKTICTQKINNIIIPVSYNTSRNKYVIIDGFHRTSIYLNNDVNYIKCKIKNNNLFKD